MRVSSATGSFLIGFATLASTAAAFAQTKVPGVKHPPTDTPAGRFGMGSQIALSSDEGINTSFSTTEGTKTLRFTLRPAIDYFVIDNVSLGATAGLDYISVGDENASVYSVGPRIGYNISFKSMFSVWPRLGISYAVREQSADFGTGRSCCIAIARRLTSDCGVVVAWMAPAGVRQRRTIAGRQRNAAWDQADVGVRLWKVPVVPGSVAPARAAETRPVRARASTNQKVHSTNPTLGVPRPSSHP